MSRLTSFRAPLNAVVVGASGGIGGALVRALGELPETGSVIACARSDRVPGSLYLDLEAEASIAAAAAEVRDRVGEVDLVIVATGLLHDGPALRPEKSFRALSAESLARAFAVNSTGPALVAKHFLPLLPRDRKAVFAALSARVGSIADNDLGGWYGYRASKAALNMLIRCAAIELARRHPLAACVALHPGTVDTALSAPFQTGVSPERLLGPDLAARRLLEVVDRLDAAGSGRLYAWDGSTIPF